uniref:Uncharacterized protein n=1 Tax=Arundo donax TaxID=35708 RepID=A0A0A9ADW3_ARUDO
MVTGCNIKKLYALITDCIFLSLDATRCLPKY